ncbi:MAG: hypothetical protein IK115_12650 [Lachnospiraceae bacterium]|nr:hypothetical protein [Lachnospiraceae bacterium]
MKQRLCIPAIVILLLAGCASKTEPPAQQPADPTPTAAATPTPTPVPEEESVSEDAAEEVPEAAEDRSDLYAPAAAESFDVSAAGGAWTQDDILTLDEALQEKLVPGTVLELEYTSESGNIWLMFPHAIKKGAEVWARVGVGEHDGSGSQYAYINQAHSIAQIRYEQLEAVLGKDKAKWGDVIQAESDGDWEVFGVKLGKAQAVPGLQDAAEFGKEAEGDAWAPGDVIPDLTKEEVSEALVKGSVIEISYTSDTGDLWIELPDAEAADPTLRIGAGDSEDPLDYVVCQEGKCYITYESIAALGGKKESWGKRLQADSSGPWKVSSVRIGKAAELIPCNMLYPLTPGTASGEAGKAEDVATLPAAEELAKILVPGSFINIRYSSERDSLWLVFPDAVDKDGEKCTVRVGLADPENKLSGSVCNGLNCQISYEMIVKAMGNEDISSWGSRLQAESDGSWEVYSVNIGSVK